MPTGIRSLETSRGKSYEASVYDARAGKKIRRNFPTLAAARSWRSDALVALRKGSLRSSPSATVREAGSALIAGMRDGSVPARGGGKYRARVVDNYEAGLIRYVLPALGPLRLADIQARDVQALVDQLRADGLAAMTIRNALMPLRVVYRRAVSRGDVAVNPTLGLELPAITGTRDRIATPVEAASLISAVLPRDRALWATAFYAGLRRGELAALDWSCVDLAGGVIRVERAWDDHHRTFTEPKTNAGRRRVPIPGFLRAHLASNRLGTGGRGLVFGATPDRPFTPSAVRRRALTAWAAFNKRLEDEDAKLRPIGLHEARHTCASIFIAAGVNAKALSAFMGHSSVSITLDRYGHLMPGSEEHAAELVDAYLATTERQSSASERQKTRTITDVHGQPRGTVGLE